MTDTTPAAPTAHPAFSAAWAEAWGKELNANPTYRKVAAKWEGDIVLEMAVDDAQVGRCDLPRPVARGLSSRTGSHYRRSFRPPGTSSRPIAIAWRQVLGGTLSPAMAILTGRLRLARGSLTDFLPYASAAEALLVTGGTIEATFPDE